MGTKNNPGRFDCYTNAHPDEPMFILLGRDRQAAALVRWWANTREALGENPEMLAEARQCANAMEQWCISLGKTPITIAQKALPEPKRYTHPHFGPVDGFVKAEDYDALRQRAEKLEEQHEKMKHERDGWERDHTHVAGELQAAESLLTAERQKNEGLARDAERYRFIFTHDYWFIGHLGDPNYEYDDKIQAKEEADDRIDKAIAARSRQGAGE